MPSTPTRFIGGINTFAPNNRFARLPIPWVNPDWQVYFNHFSTFDPNEWLATVVDTDTDGTAARTIDATAGGVLNILNANNAADSTNLALGGAGAEPFKMASGKQTWLGAKFSSTDVDKNTLFIGLAAGDVDLQGGLPNDHFLIRVDTADANIDVSCGVGGTPATSLAVGTVSDYAEGTNNLTEVVCWYDGKTTVHIWVDGVPKTPIDVTSNIPDTEMTLVMEIHNSDGAADAMAVDWVLVAQEL